MSATKNIVGMINRSRRITYLSTAHWPRTECKARCFLNMVAGNRRSRLSPAPSHDYPSLTRSSAPLRHVRIDEATLLEAERGEVEVLDPWLFEHRVRVVVDPGRRRVLREETRSPLVEIVALLWVRLLVAVGHELVVLRIVVSDLCHCRLGVEHGRQPVLLV